MAQSTSSTGNQPLIELRHVDKHYGDLHVLNDINLSASPCRRKARILPACVPSWAWCFSSSTCSHI